MRLHYASRLVAVVLAVGAIAPVTALLVGSGGNAYASGDQITCTKLSGSASTQDVSKCTGPSAILAGEKAGKGTGVSTIDGSAPAGYEEGSTTTFGKGGAGGSINSGVNITGTSGPGKGTPCGNMAETLDEQTTALSGTGAAAGLVGDTGTGVVCYDASANTVKLPKGDTIGF